MSLYLGSEKVENITAQITLPVEPSDDLPLADGTASAGTSKKFSRADHVHPMETVEATLVDIPSDDTKLNKENPIASGTFLLDNTDFQMSIVPGQVQYIRFTNPGYVIFQKRTTSSGTYAELIGTRTYENEEYIYVPRILPPTTDTMPATKKYVDDNNQVFVCTFTQSGSTYTCDKTFDEIQEAYTIGKVCIAKYSYYAYYLEYAYIYGLVFCHTRGATQEEFTLGQDNTITHVQRTLSTPPTARKITLTTSGWSNNQQAVTCTGVSSSVTSQEIRVMPADATKTSAYVSCGVSCVAQAANKLTFACDKVPTTAIDVYVVMQSLNFQS